MTCSRISQRRCGQLRAPKSKENMLFHTKKIISFAVKLFLFNLVVYNLGVCGADLDTGLHCMPLAF